MSTNLDFIFTIFKYLIISTSLNSESKKEGHHNECPVCLEAFADDERIRILACRHTFHSDCIITWLERNTSCPMCRKLIEYNELLAMPESQQNLAADNTNDEYNDPNA
ncbi:MAG: hypothetical protein MHMPM18_002222 [Marteilia pararefringens]